MTSGVRHTVDEGRDGVPYLLGTPKFDLPLEGSQRIPIGQAALVAEGRKRVRSKKQLRSAVEAEYRGIVESLLEMGIGFRILNLNSADPEFVRWARSKGCSSLEFPVKEPSRWLIYPRDMAVYLEHANILLMHARLFNSRSSHKRGTEILYSTMAEGGRVLFAGNRILLGRTQGRQPRGERKLSDRLRTKGLLVVDLPPVLAFSCPGPGFGTGLFHDSHLDRCAGLLKGKDGGYHLILDPGYRTGPLLSPHGPIASIDLVRRACARIEVEVHVPKSMSVPMATALVQLEGNRVLTSSGDDDRLLLIENIVGADKLHTTKIPLVHYPIFAGAGLHCLVTENPKPLIRKSGTFG